MTSSPPSVPLAGRSEVVSTPSPSTTTTAETEVAPAKLLPKNVRRLNRIFRKPKTVVAKRSWHVPPAEGAPAPRRVGIPYEVVEALVQSLTEEEKQRASARLNPLTEVELALQKRAMRFGVFTPTSTEEVLKQQQRQARFGMVTASPPVQLSEEDRAAMEARARRFGSA